MPYEVHPEIVTPSDDTVLWRYMDFAKFVHMIDTKSLWFARQDQFEDPLEGNLTDGELERIRALMISNPLMGDGYLRGPEFMRKSIFVNCWRSGLHESLAMWDLYGKGSGIVAAKTTVGLLKQALNDFTRPVYIAEVGYIDWGREYWLNNALLMCARKDISYQHESEVRAMVWRHDLLTAETIPVGLSMPFDPKRFLAEVVVGPREPGWVTPLLTNVMKAYGLPQPVSVSNRLTPRK